MYRIVRTLVAILCIVAVNAPLRAQGMVTLRADFNTGPNQQAFGGVDRFKNATFFDGRTFFTMRSRTHGVELWVTDGTALNTRLFADICPGQCSAFDTFPVPSFYVEGSNLYFAANDGKHGRELWRLQVGANTPTMVADLNPGAESSSPEGFKRTNLSINSSVVTRTFFAATRADIGSELWRLNNSTTPTATLELDVLPGAASASPADIQLCSTSQVCFIARHASGSREVRLLNYTSTSAPPTGSSGVGDLNIGANRSVSDLQSLGPNTFVMLRDFSTLDEVRVFTNSAASSVLLDTFSSASALLTPNVPLFRVFYAADSQLVVSDGTPAGTQSISSASPANLVSLSNRLLMTANTASNGRELFSSDGTAAGTGLLKELVAGAQGLPTFSGLNMLPSANGGRLFISFNNPAVSNDMQVWISDGSAAGTVEISGSAINDSGALSILPTTGTSAVIGYNPGSGDSGEPFFTQGTVGSTVALGNFIADAGDSFASPIVAFNQRVFVVAQDQPTANGHYTLPSQSNAAPSPFMLINGAMGVFFQRLWFEGSGLYVSDGTIAGSTLLPDVDIRSDDPACYVMHNGLVHFFVSDTAFNDVEISRSDGTAAGTEVVTNLSTTDEARMDRFCFGIERVTLASLPGKLLFAGDNGNSGLELYGLDDNDNAALVMDIRVGSATSEIGAMLTLTNRPGLPDVVVFNADDGIFGREIWASGGTGQSTVRLSDFNPGIGSSDPTNVVHAGNRIFFTAFSPATGRELYVSDGTVAGTRQVADLFVGSGSGISSASFHRILASANGKVYFSGISSSEPDCALFESDGSGPGTHCAYDDASFALRSVGNSAVVNRSGALIFSAHQSVPVDEGEEVRVLFNGQMLNVAGSDMALGGAGSAPSDFLADGDSVYFRADDGIVGFELFKLSLPDLGALFANGFD